MDNKDHNYNDSIKLDNLESFYKSQIQGQSDIKSQKSIISCVWSTEVLEWLETFRHNTGYCYLSSGISKFQSEEQTRETIIPSDPLSNYFQ